MWMYGRILSPFVAYGRTEAVCRPGAFTCFGVVMALAVQFYGGVSKQQSFHRLIEWVRQNDGFVSCQISRLVETLFCMCVSMSI